MNRQELFYELPEKLIAQVPTNPRDHSRLFVYDRKNKDVEHKHFYDIVSYFNPGDVLVLNDTKVFPARLFGKKETSGGIEILLLNELSKDSWEVLARGNKKVATKVIFGKGFYGVFSEKLTNGTWIMRFNKAGTALRKAVDSFGEMPLPPYITSKKGVARYQTVYAEQRGSVAAPTAGLHFTKALLTKLTKNGVRVVYLTLHVGYGTFKPIKDEEVEHHKIHEEFCTVPLSVVKEIRQAKKRGARVVAVGTTTTRALESAARAASKKEIITPYSGATDLYILPGYTFKVVGALITNFHLPFSTLLLLVGAFIDQGKGKKAGVATIKKLYQEAIRKKYRFYSFGDAMFIE